VPRPAEAGFARDPAAHHLESGRRGAGTAIDIGLPAGGKTTMKRIGLSAAFVFILSVAFGGAGARAATPSGLSVGVGLDLFHDGTVTDTSSGESVHDRSGELGLGLLANFGDFAVGGGLGWTPDIFGDGRLLVGARAGWQPTFGTTRVQLLGELGIHRYTHVDEGWFSVSTPEDFSTPYVGAQLGMTREFVKGSLVEYGVALFVRQDVNQQPIVHQDENFLGGPMPAPTNLTVGGTMIGLSATLGFRVDSANVHADHSVEFGR
jgi:hypothetical protein